MRALAEFIMRGRAQAATVALLGAFVPFLSPAAVALVTLRGGGWNGFYVIGWAMLPVVVMTIVSPETLPMSFFSLCALVATLGGAMVLRSQGNWSVSLLGLLAVSATAGAVFGNSFPEFNAELVTEMNRVQEQASTEQQRQGGEEIKPVQVTGTLISGLMASFVALNAVLSLVIGRWWQAMLYNPGGFRAEFYELRLGPTQALFCFGVAALGISQPNWLFWGLLAALPLFLVSAAVVHNRVRAKGWGLPWLVLFYLAMLFQPFFLAAVLIGFTDTWVDYRRRFGPQGAEHKDLNH